MRTIINISLPKSMAAFVRREAKRRRYTSVSEFVRKLVRGYEEEQVLKIVEQGRKEYREGKAKTLRSLKELR